MTTRDTAQLHTQIVDDTYYHRDTPSEVVRVLEQARKTGLRIRIHYGDTATGLDWMDVYDVRGTIGRSLGPVRVPLMIARSGSSGGPAILDHCIVRIRHSAGGGPDLYRHPEYRVDQDKVVHFSERERDREWPGWND